MRFSKPYCTDNVIKFAECVSYYSALGCSITEWPKVIKSFYQSSEHGNLQVVDEDFVSYVWSLLVRSPGVRVGIRPNDAPPVWIAPKPAKGTKTDVEAKPELQLIGDQVHSSTFSELLEQYGKTLHIAAEHEIIFTTLTGSHVQVCLTYFITKSPSSLVYNFIIQQPSKLTPMAYTALQIIARSGDRGLAIDDITKETKYLSGTVFYLVKSLVELGLMYVLSLKCEAPILIRLFHSLKLRTGGQSINIAIHRHFWERSPTWQRIQEEELALQERGSLDEGDGEDGEQAPKRESEAALDDDEDGSASDAEAAKFEASKLQFDVIDARFLSSAPLVRSRLIKLLKHSKNHMHAYKNIMVAIVGVPSYQISVL